MRHSVPDRAFVRQVGLPLAIAGSALALGVLGVARTPPELKAFLIVTALPFGLFAATSGWLAARYISQLKSGLRLSNARFQKLTDGSADLVTRHDASGRTLFASKASLAVVGTPSLELVSVGLTEKIHVQDRVTFLQAVQTALAGEDVDCCQLRLRNKGREGAIWQTVEMTFQRAEAEGSEANEVIVTTRQRKSSDKTVSAPVAAQDNPNRQNQFACLGHELRTPLNAISGYAQLLAGRHDQNGRDSVHAENIMLATGHMLAVIERMDAYATLEGGSYEPRTESCTLGEIAQFADQLLHQVKDGQKAEVVFDIPATLPSLRSDRQALIQIFVNLVGNAIKFGPRCATVNVRARQFGQNIKLTISDKGTGLPPSLLAKIGDPNATADLDRNRANAGTGLGLFIATNLVAALKGTFEVKSTGPRGTCIELTIPIAVRKPMTGGVENISRHSSPSHQYSPQYKGDDHARLSA